MDWNLVLKIATGIIIVPLAILGHLIWPWWVQSQLPVKIMSSIVVLPIIGLAAVLTPWWEGM